MEGNQHPDKSWLARPGKFARTKLVVKDHLMGHQTDTYGSWGDMNALISKEEFLKAKPSKELPRHLRGELKALYHPTTQTDWLLAPDKDYKRAIYLDTNGSINYNYMEAKWTPGRGEDPTREQFLSLLCTHLTLHFVCIGPNYWDFTWPWGPAEEARLSTEE